MRFFLFMINAMFAFANFTMAALMFGKGNAALGTFNVVVGLMNTAAAVTLLRG